MAYQLSSNTWIDDNGVAHSGYIGSAGQNIANPVVQDPGKPVYNYVPAPANEPLQTYQQVAVYGYQTDPKLAAAESKDPFSNINSVFDLYSKTGIGVPVSVLNSGSYPVNTVTNNLPAPVVNVPNYGSSSTSNLDSSSYSGNAIPFWTVTPLASNSSIIPASTIVNPSTGSSFINAIMDSPMLDMAVIGLVAWMVFKR